MQGDADELFLATLKKSKSALPHALLLEDYGLKTVAGAVTLEIDFKIIVSEVWEGESPDEPLFLHFPHRFAQKDRLRAKETPILVKPLSILFSYLQVFK